MARVSERVVDLVSALVEIPTHETEEEAQRLVASWLDACGFRCRLQQVAPRRENVIAQRGEGGPLLCSHADTHPPHAHEEPFVCRRENGTLVGRGVVDAKGQIAALVAACEETAPAPATIVITCDEEGRGLGSEQLAMPRGPWHNDGGIVLEPTNFRVCTSQAGHIDLVIRTYAPPGHAYAPESAGSPIAAVLAAIDSLETASVVAARHPLLPPPRVHVGRIDGGEHLWRRPAGAGAQIAIAILPGVDLDDARDEVRSRLDDLGRRWASRGTALRYEIADASEPVEVSPDLPIALELAKAIGTLTEPAGMPSWTDAGNLLVHHGIPCVVFGAGDLAAAHSDHEWVRAEDLGRLSDILARLLRNYG